MNEADHSMGHLLEYLLFPGSGTLMYEQVIQQVILKNLPKNLEDCKYYHKSVHQLERWLKVLGEDYNKAVTRYHRSKKYCEQHDLAHQEKNSSDQKLHEMEEELVVESWHLTYLEAIKLDMTDKEA